MEFVCFHFRWKQKVAPDNPTFSLSSSRTQPLWLDCAILSRSQSFSPSAPGLDGSFGKIWHSSICYDGEEQLIALCPPINHPTNYSPPRTNINLRLRWPQEGEALMCYSFNSKLCLSCSTAKILFLISIFLLFFSKSILTLLSKG